VCANRYAHSFPPTHPPTHPQPPTSLMRLILWLVCFLRMLCACAVSPHVKKWYVCLLSSMHSIKNIYEFWRMHLFFASCFFKCAKKRVSRCTKSLILCTHSLKNITLIPNLTPIPWSTFWQIGECESSLHPLISLYKE